MSRSNRTACDHQPQSWSDSAAAVTLTDKVLEGTGAGRSRTLSHKAVVRTWAGELKQVSVWIFEVNASAAVPIVQLAVVEAPGSAAV